MTDPRATQLIAVFELVGKFTPDTVIPTEEGWMTIREAYKHGQGPRCFSYAERSQRGVDMNDAVHTLFKTLKPENS